MTVKLIGICGYKGTGKTTITRAAIEGYPSNMVQIGFSDPIYAMFSAMGIPENLLYDKSCWEVPLPMLDGKTIRFAFTSLGTDWGRTMIGQRIWTDLAMARVQYCQRAGQVVVIDNVRFKSEAQTIQDRGGYIIAFSREGYEPDLSHESEQEIEEIQQDLCMFRFMNPGRSLKAVATEFFGLLEFIKAG